MGLAQNCSFAVKDRKAPFPGSDPSYTISFLLQTDLYSRIIYPGNDENLSQPIKMAEPICIKHFPQQVIRHLS